MDLPQLRLERGRPVDADESAQGRGGHSGDEPAEPFGPYRGLKPGPGRSAAEVISHQRARIDRALVEVVAERGYSRATVREIARVAGISTRAFYERCAGKEECFLRVHRLLARRLLRRMDRLADVTDTTDHLKAAVETVIEEWGRDWKVTWFLLIGPYGAGPAAMTQLRVLDQSLGVRLSRCLRDAPEGGVGSTGIVADGIAAGLTATVRLALLNNVEAEWSALGQGLTEWAVSWSGLLREHEEVQAENKSVRFDSSAGLTLASDTKRTQGLSLGDDRTLLHAAIVKLAASGDRSQLTPRLICAAAGVSRRSFEVYFAGVDDCLVEAAGLQLDFTLARIRRASNHEASPARRAFHDFVDLFRLVGRDPALASLCFGDVIKSGEWLLRRDQLLTERFARLLAVATPASHSQGRLRIDASVGSILGLLRKEITAGRSGCVSRQAPSLANLMLAPTLGASSTAGVISS